MSSDPQPRLLRLQFSLRWLLLLTTAVGLGLMVYRWPWEVVRVKSGAPYERPAVIVTTLRREWSGRPQKHGSERAMELELHRGSESLYVDGELIRRRFYVDGRMTKELFYHAGFAYRPRTEELPSDEIRGVWHSVKKFDSETVTQRCEWRNAERHGLSTWTSSSGQLLQSAEFNRGRIVRWNGEPVEEALARWVEKNVSEPQFRKALLGSFDDYEAFYPEAMNGRGFQWFDNEATRLTYFGFVYRQDAGPTESRPRYQGQIIGEALLETALGESGMLAHHYGAPCVVRICTSEMNWQDPTNVSSVKFAAGSPAARDWGELAIVDGTWHRGPPVIKLSVLCQVTAIALDLSAVRELEPLPASERSEPPYPRPRRDVFAHVLYDAGYRCEQRGNTIVVLPGKK